MAVSILDLVAAEKKLAIPVKDDFINVTYQPEFYTLGVEKALKEANESSEKMAGFVGMFLDIVQVWDLADKQGVVIPLSLDGIREAGVTLNSLNFVLQAIMADINEGEVKAQS